VNGRLPVAAAAVALVPPAAIWLGPFSPPVLPEAMPVEVEVVGAEVPEPAVDDDVVGCDEVVASDVEVAADDEVDASDEEVEASDDEDGADELVASDDELVASDDEVADELVVVRCVVEVLVEVVVEQSRVVVVAMSLRTAAAVTRMVVPRSATARRWWVPPRVPGVPTVCLPALRAATVVVPTSSVAARPTSAGASMPARRGILIIGTSPFLTCALRRRAWCERRVVSATTCRTE
jgi:hypothetical protein